MNTPLISIITPTCNRAPYLSLLWECILQQNYQNWEWLIHDDSPMANPFLIQLAKQDPRVHYIHSHEKHSIGHKRNMLIQQANGEFIAQFDDDDYYTPYYLGSMLNICQEHESDLVKLSSFYLYCPELDFFGYMDLTAKVGHHYILEQGKISTFEFHEKKQIGADFIVFYGFSYFYKKELALNFPYQDISLSEDEHFARAIILGGKRFSVFEDTDGLCLHLVHANSTSRCFARYNLPPFLRHKIFPLHRLPQLM